MTLTLPSRKDDPPRDKPLPASVPESAPAIPPTPTAADYRALLVKHRRTQLEMTRDHLQRLAQTYDRAAAAIVERVRALPDSVERTGTGWLNAQLNLLIQIDEEVARFRADYGQLLDLSMLSTAQQAADREAEVARLVGAPVQPNLLPSIERTITLSTGVDITAQFGVLARSAVEGVANRYYRDGLQLSQRLYNLQQETRKVVEDTIVQGIAQGTSARDLATQVQAAMAKDGVQTPRYNAMRIARTEINNTHREATVQAVIDPDTGGTKSYVTGVRWNLSLSHPAPDICCRKGTLVETESGPRAIEDIKIGERVLTHEGRHRAVIRLYRNTIPAGQLVRLCFRVGKSRTHELTVTPNHPVLTEQGWVPAGDLQTGRYGRSLPSMLAGPYAQSSSGTSDTTTQGFGRSCTWQLLRSVGAELCGGQLPSPRRIGCNSRQEPLSPTCSLSTESDSDKVLCRRSSSDYLPPCGSETIAAAVRQAFATYQDGDCRNSDWNLQLTEGGIARSNTLFVRNASDRIACRILSKSAVFEHEPQDNILESRMHGSLSGSFVRQRIPCHTLGKSRASACHGISTEPRSSESRTVACGAGSQTYSIRQVGEVRRTIRKALRTGFVLGCKPLGMLKYRNACREFLYRHELPNQPIGVLSRIARSISSYIYYTLQEDKNTTALLVRVDRIATSGEVVYNLGVADDNSYFAGGIAVHNCDVWAAHDEGLGSGVYSPDSTPVDHPHGLCYLTSELKAFPGVGGSGKQANVADVPESQIRYYAERQSDVPAQALLSRRGQ